MNKTNVLRFIAAFITLAILLSFATTLPVAAAADRQVELNSTTLVINNIASDTLWTAGNVYYLLTDIEVASGVTLTIERGTVVKFWVPLDPSSATNLVGLNVKGNLRFIDPLIPPADPVVVFTSGRDDTIGGDTNADGNQTLPAPGDWDFVRLTNWTNTDPAYDFLKVRYGKDGLRFDLATAVTVQPVFENNIFSENVCGLTLSFSANGFVNANVQYNTFTQNKYGFCTRRTNGLGSANPVLTENNFNNNSILPIYLSGTAYPSYVDNSFIGYVDPLDRLGIGLGGEIHSSGTLTIVENLPLGGIEMPFVIVAPMEIKAGAALNVPGGAVFKGFTRAEMALPADPLPYFRISGVVNFGSVDEASRIIFTSYRDDSVGGDTNGDNFDSEPYARDWAGVHFRDQSLEAAPNTTFQYLSFNYAVNGLTYETTLAGTRSPVIDHVNFIGNLNGLRFKSLPKHYNSRITPTIQNSLFSKQGIIPEVKADTEPGVPILLENTIQPTYVNNTYTENLHPAIGLSGYWYTNATFNLESGQGLNPLPFLVHGDLWLGYRDITFGVDTPVFTVPEGTIFKFFVNLFDRNSRSGMQAAGRLTLNSTLENPVVFTSYLDNAYGGDTSGVSVLPGLKDWADVVVRHTESNFIHTVFRYGSNALHLQNKQITGFIDPEVSNSLFEYNDIGLYLDIQEDGDITSLVSDNIFRYNAVGLGTYAAPSLNATERTMGLSAPVLLNNLFSENTLFPIYLNGSATLEFYDPSNELINNAHTAIALGGYFGAEKIDPTFSIILPRIYAGPTLPLSAQLVPYVVWANTNFDWYTPTWLAGGVVVKFNTAMSLNFYGTLTMATSAVDRNIFTSYRDDTVGGDNNGTPVPNPPPAPGDWKGLYIYNPLSSPVRYSQFNYSDDGLVIYQHKNNPTPNDFTLDISYNTFQFNKNGLSLKIGGDWDILSPVTSNIFVENYVGLHTFTETSNPHGGTSNPILTDNNFSQHSDFPIYLQGSSDPTYTGNDFWDNTHPAIALGGIWVQDATWTSVYDGTLDQMMPYVVKENLLQEIYWFLPPTITMPESLVVKVMTDKNLYLTGYLLMESAPGTEIIFTAYADDSKGGDIDANGAPTSISRSAWKSVWLYDFPGKNNHVHDAQFYYATVGLTLYYDGPENTQTATLIEDTLFKDSHSGMALVVGWRQVGLTIYGGQGNINPTVRNTIFLDSNYGILTVAHDKAIGINKPVLENITFSNISFYPMFFGGTTYPSFVAPSLITGAYADNSLVSGLQASGSEPVLAEMTVAGLDLPGNRVVFENIEPGSASLAAVESPRANLMADPYLYPAIGLAGAWNNSGELVQVDGVPYAVVGGFPLSISSYNFSYTPSANVTIGAVNAENTTLTVPAGSVFKVSSTLMMVAKGTLNLLSTDTQPVIFTSIKDDSIAGDTNKDGITTRPAKGDWAEIQLAATNTFHHAVVRYAVKGLHIFFNGAVNFNNATTVSDSKFIENTAGITLSANDNGDIWSSIESSTFNQNTTHILGNAPAANKTGHLCVEAHNNDLFGLKATQVGIVNNNLFGPSPALPVDCSEPAFDARQNYWGDATGPYHPTLNTAGLGSTVSDRVAFDPWLTNPINPIATYSISGRVTKDTPDGEGLVGVIVNLQGPVPTGTTAITDSQGYYQFNDLQNGAYLVSPGLLGYAFTPSFLNINLNSADSTDSNFVGIIHQGVAAFSVNSVSSMRPWSTSIKKYCTFTISVSGIPAGGDASVSFETFTGTAIPTRDYFTNWGTKKFLSGQASTYEFKVELKVTPAPWDPPLQFFLYLKTPVNGYLYIPNGSCTIEPTFMVFAPFIKK